MSRRGTVSLQILRGIAATAVVLHDSFRAVTINKGDPAFGDPFVIGNAQLVDFGSAGVDLFFVLSGFLMAFISAPYVDRTRAISHFFAQRLIRIWPLYAIVTTVLGLTLLKNSLGDGALPFDLQTVRLLSYVFIPLFDQRGLPSKVRPQRRHRPTSWVLK